MPTYTWWGINQHGKKISGTDHADNFNQLKTTLIQQKILPLKITPFFISTFWHYSKITSKHITYFTEQLAILINANTPIIKALTIISQDEKNSELKKLINNCQNSIAAGKSLYQTLKQYPQHFTPLFCGLVNVGEQSGTLDTMLLELADHRKKAEIQKRKLMQALLYPLAILGITLIVTVILLVFVIPQFAIMFNNFGAKLPAYTQIIVNLSKILQAIWPALLGIVSGTIIGIKIIQQRSIKFRKFLDKLYLNVPVVKTVVTYSIIMRFTKTLWLTLKSGMPLLTALTVSATTISSLSYQLAIENATKLIANGKTLHQALEEQNLFPAKVIQLVALGEETGVLESMLEKISLVYNDALNNFTDNLNQLLEPIIMLILGVIVGGLVIGMYLPVFRLGTII